MELSRATDKALLWQAVRSFRDSPSPKQPWELPATTWTKLGWRSKVLVAGDNPDKGGSG